MVDRNAEFDRTPARAEAISPNPRLFERRPSPQREEPGRPVPLPKPGKWNLLIREWLAEHHERVPDRRRRARPYLDCTSNFHPQIVSAGVGEPTFVSFTVWNDGNLPAWTCYVELYEGPGWYDNPLSDYELRGRRIVTLHPGEHRDIALPWVRQEQTGRIVGIVFDPVLDPRDFVLVEQYNRHITSAHYTNLP